MSAGDLQLATSDDAAGEWQDLALCQETDPDLFYPEKGGSVTAAKGVCARCPVTAECLEYALQTDERFGIWGGKSESERRRLKSERRRLRVVAQ